MFYRHAGTPVGAEFQPEKATFGRMAMLNRIHQEYTDIAITPSEESDVENLALFEDRPVEKIEVEQTPSADHISVKVEENEVRASG